MMKRVFGIILFLLILLPISNVYAYTTESECVTAVNQVSDREYLLLRDLNSYFATYKDDLLDISDYDAIYGTDNYDVASVIDRIILLLNNKNHTAAATELSSMKDRIVTDYNYVKGEYYAIKDYVANTGTTHTSAIDEILIAIKSNAPKYRDEAKTFYNNYFDMYKEDLKTKFENQNLSATDYEHLVDKIYNNTFGVTKYRNELVDLQNYFNTYHLEDYEELINDYLEEYRSFIDSKYNEVIDYAKTLSKKEVQKRVNVYKQTLDENDPTSVDEYNGKVLALVDRADYYKSYYDNKKTSINEYILVDMFKPRILAKEEYIDECFEKLKDYIRTFLIDVNYIELKDPTADGDLIKIDNVNHLIIYYEHEDLSVTTFLNKLKARVGTIESSFDYNGNVGTKAKIVNIISATQSVTYDVIVKGDVLPDGKISAQDYVRIKNHIMESTIITDEYLRIAADINDDNKISAVDYVRIKNIIMSRGN